MKMNKGYNPMSRTNRRAWGASQDTGYLRTGGREGPQRVSKVREKAQGIKSMRDRKEAKDQRLKERRMGYAKGGMAKCGASNPPNGKSRK